MLHKIIQNQVPNGVQSVVLSILILVLVSVLSFYIGKITLLKFFKRALRARDVDEHARSPLMKLAWFALLLLSITLGFGAAGFGNFLTALATISAAGTLAVGFAMKDVIGNFVSGVLIFVDKPFKIGDWIEWSDKKGEVEDIGMRVTRVRTFDNELLTVPNRELADSTVKNPVDAETLRIQLPFGIGYADDIQEATDIIIEEAEKHDDILDEPNPTVRLVELGDSAVVLRSRVWISNPSRSKYVRVQSEYFESVKNRFDDAGIDMPYPHMQLLGSIETTEPQVRE